MLVGNQVVGDSRVEKAAVSAVRAGYEVVVVGVSHRTTFNLGRFGWSPTVQLTALLRAHPAPGWLGIAVRTSAVQGGWFDEDATVTDATGRVVVQARQLALLPR